MWFTNRALCTATRRTNGCAHVCRELATLINIHVLHTVLFTIGGLPTIDDPANNVLFVNIGMEKKPATCVF